MIQAPGLMFVGKTEAYRGEKQTKYTSLVLALTLYLLFHLKYHSGFIRPQLISDRNKLGCFATFESLTFWLS